VHEDALVLLWRHRRRFGRGRDHGTERSTQAPGCSTVARQEGSDAGPQERGRRGDARGAPTVARTL